MVEKVTLELPRDLADQVRTVAASTRRTFDEVLLEWVRTASTKPVLELLPDEQLLAVADSQLTPDQDEELSELLDRNREGELSPTDRVKLEELMSVYRLGLVRKAHAIQVAVSRGLRPPLG